MKRSFLSQTGTSLLELSIAMLIGSIVISGAYKAHEYVSHSTERENKKALIQRDIIDVTEKIGHDIRMAGIGLPGNGVQMALYDTSSDQLEIFLNETKSQTKLATNLSFYDVKILVVDCSKAVSDGWVCIASNGLDTLYRKVSSIGNCTVSGPDTIHLSGIVAAGVFTVAATDIYFCKRIMYRVQKSGSVVNLVVQRNQIAVNLGENLDTLNIEPQNSTGTVLTSSFENTATIVIFAGGYVGTGLNRNLISESTQINIRNRD